MRPPANSVAVYFIGCIENLHLRKKCNINMNIMNTILEAVNIPKYLPLRFLFSFAYKKEKKQNEQRK